MPGHLIIGARRFENRPLPQIIAQHPVDQPLVRAAGDFAGGADRLIDDGMRRLRSRAEPIQRHQQQRLADRVGQGPLKQPAENEFPVSIAAQSPVTDFLHRRPCRRRPVAEHRQGLCQAAPGTHRGNDPGGQRQTARQRIRRQRTGRSRPGDCPSRRPEGFPLDNPPHP